ERWQSLLREDRTRGFDMRRAPLMRIILVRIGDDAFRFAWSSHHLILDGWSRPLAFKEVVAFYRAARSKTTLNLPPARKFRDYIAWLKKQDLGKAEAYWRLALAGFHAPTPLEVERPVEPVSGQGKKRLTVAAATAAAIE